MILKLVSRSDEAVKVTIDLKALNIFKSNAAAIVLSGDPMAENRFGQPPSILPKKTQIEVSEIFDYEILPHSLTVIRVPAK